MPNIFWAYTSIHCRGKAMMTTIRMIHLLLRDPFEEIEKNDRELTKLEDYWADGSMRTSFKEEKTVFEKSWSDKEAVIYDSKLTNHGDEGECARSKGLTTSRY